MLLSPYVTNDLHCISHSCIAIMWIKLEQIRSNLIHINIKTLDTVMKAVPLAIFTRDFK